MVTLARAVLLPWLTYAALLLSAPSLGADCDAIFRAGIHNQSDRMSDRAMQSLFTLESCRQRYDTLSEAQRTEVSERVSVFLFAEGGADVRTGRAMSRAEFESACERVASFAQRHKKETIMVRSIVPEAYSAWVRCLELASKNIELGFSELTDDSIGFSFRPLLPGVDFRINSITTLPVQPSERSWVCVNDAHKVVSDIDNPVAIRIGANAAYQIACTRTLATSVVHVDGHTKKARPASAIAVSTSVGPVYFRSPAMETWEPPSAWVQPGTIVAFAGRLEPPGWLLCDGRQLPKQGKYAALYSAIGDLYGPSTDSAMFRIPDVRGSFLRGDDNGRGLDPGRRLGTQQSWATGRPVVPFQIGSAGVHSHLDATWNGLPGTAELATEYRGIGGVDYVPPGSTSPAGMHSHELVGGGDPETRPVNLAVTFLIKY